MVRVEAGLFELFELLSATVSPQDFLLWCKNLPIDNALRALKIGGLNRGRSYQIFIPDKLDLTFQAPNECAKFHQNCGRRSVYRQTDGMMQVIL